MATTWPLAITTSSLHWIKLLLLSDRPQCQEHLDICITMTRRSLAVLISHIVPRMHPSPTFRPTVARPQQTADSPAAAMQLADQIRIPTLHPSPTITTLGTVICLRSAADSSSGATIWLTKPTRRLVSRMLVV